ncbi:MAG: metallopeptidase family protein [Chloroflexi bacterium]|nr:metallopeptidase family protein [Chloroflexota bacterium]
MNRRAFERLVREALEGLPEELLACMDNVDVVVEDWPTKDQLVAQGMEDRYDLFGLYEGYPLTDREHYNMVLPDKISIFQRPIEACCRNPEEMVREVRITVAHEIAHHFGIDDERLEALGLG